jgi:hypothetical protein
MRGKGLTQYGKQYKDAIDTVLQRDEYKDVITNALEKAEKVRKLNKDKNRVIQTGHIKNIEEEEKIR